MPPKFILVIIGPTASSKSSLAVQLAKKLNGEIVSADSRQVYKGLDIGSGKITRREMAGIPHHMLDVANPRRIFTVSQYQKLAYKTIDDILSRGKLPIVVGGTGQYIDAITKGLILPGVKPLYELRKQLSYKTTQELFALLEKLDPARAKNIDRHNARRLVRAIEIAKVLGKVPVLKTTPRYSPITIGVKIKSIELKRCIHKRLLARMQTGMVAEVRSLRKQGLSCKRLFDLGLEYRYVSLCLQGKFSKHEMLVKLETEINHYAKRQMTWFKRDKSITWLPKNQVVNLNPSLFRRIRSRLRADVPSNP